MVSEARVRLALKFTVAHHIRKCHGAEFAADRGTSEDDPRAAPGGAAATHHQFARAHCHAAREGVRPREEQRARGTRV